MRAGGPREVRPFAWDAGAARGPSPCRCAAVPLPKRPGRGTGALRAATPRERRTPVRRAAVAVGTADHTDAGVQAAKAGFPTFQPPGPTGGREADGHDLPGMRRVDLSRSDHDGGYRR